MSQCKEFESSLDAVGRDARRLAELRDASTHSRTCSRCSESLDLALLLAGVGESVEVPASELLERRARVLGSARRPYRGPRFEPGRPRALALRIGGAFAALLVGYLLGAAPWRRRPPSDPGSQIVGELARAARRPNARGAASSGPYVLTDVRLLNADGDHVEIRGIAGQEVTLRLDRRDPLLERAVVESWLREGALFQRIEAAALADGRDSASIRTALLDVLEHDPSPAVRLAVAERLAPVRGDRPAIETFLRVLREDPNVAVKLAAVDFLIHNEIAPDRLRAAAEAGDAEARGPALLRARRYRGSIAD